MGKSCGEKKKVSFSTFLPLALSLSLSLSLTHLSVSLMHL
jgi:hypothetical protein